MIYFRFHRSTLADALKTQLKFNCVEHLLYYLDNLKYSNIEISYYCFDDRDNIGDTFIVTTNNGVVGFMYLRNF